MASKKIYSIKTPDGNPVRCEEAWKDANGGLLTEKATKVSATSRDTIFVNDGTGNLKDSGVSIHSVNSYVCGGIQFSGTASAGTLVGDFEGLTQAQLMRKWPFSALYIDDVVGYTEDGIKLKVADSYLVMPNLWRKTTHSEDGSSTFMVANYQVDDTYTLAYPSSAFKELCLGVYFASLISGFYHSVRDFEPATNMTQSALFSKMPFYKTKSGLRKAEYMDYRVLALYQVLSVIYLGNRNSQSVYRGVCDYGSRYGTIADITDTSSQMTGCTEDSGNRGYMAHAVVSGELLGTSSTYSLSTGMRPFKLLGVENPYGFLWHNVYGLCWKDGKPYVLDTTADLDDEDAINPNTSSLMIEKKFTAYQGQGYQKAFSDASGYPVPISVGASSSTSVGDATWYGSGTPITIFGGRYSDGSDAGLFCLARNYYWGIATTNIGARLSYER